MFGRLKSYWRALPDFNQEIKPSFSLGNMLRAITWLGLWAGALSIPDNLLEGVPFYPAWIFEIAGVAFGVFVFFAPLMAIFSLIGEMKKGLLFCLYATLIVVILYCVAGTIISSG